MGIAGNGLIKAVYVLVLVYSSLGHLDNLGLANRVLSLCYGSRCNLMPVL